MAASFFNGGGLRRGRLILSLVAGLGQVAGLAGLGTLAAGSAHAAAAAAPSREDALTEALHFLGRINTASAMQPASCHGSFGLDLGAGVESYTLPAGNSALQTQLGLNNQTGNAYSMPRLWLTKGLPLPIDVGISAGVPGSGGGITQLSANLQWTIYQALARPALALRFDYGKLYGITGTSVSSSTAQVITSYGFWRYITLFARAGMSQNQGSLAIDGQSHLGYMLRNDEPILRTTANWVQFERAAGLRLTLWSPLLAISGEADFSYAAQPDYAVKLSYLL